MLESNRALAQGCCTAEQQAVLDVLREAAGAPLTLGEIARLASARLPQPQRKQLCCEEDVACILATLRLREGFRRAIRKHPGVVPSSPYRTAQQAGKQSGHEGREEARRWRPSAVLASARTEAASRPWPLSLPVLAATGLVAGCTVLPAQHALVFTAPVTYFPGGVVAKTEVPRSFRPFDASTVTTCSGGWGCSGPHLEAVAESTKTPLVGPLAYHADGYAEHFAQVSPRMRAWLNAPHDTPSSAEQAAAGVSTGAAPSAALAAAPTVALTGASGAGPLAREPVWTGAPPTSGSGLRLGGNVPSALWSHSASASKGSGAASPAIPQSGREWVAEQLARIDPTLPELHAHSGPTVQAAAIARAYPQQARRPAELVEVSGSHLVVAFNSGSQRITPRMREALRHVAGSLHAQEELQLRGRVGFRNPGAVGRALAVNRANAVRAELVALGVPAARIIVAEPRDGDLLASDFDSPLNRSVSMLRVQPTKVAMRPSTRPTGG